MDCGRRQLVRNLDFLLIGRLKGLIGQLIRKLDFLLDGKVKELMSKMSRRVKTSFWSEKGRVMRRNYCNLVVCQFRQVKRNQSCGDQEEAKRLEFAKYAKLRRSICI